jgi:hypothetical protein
MQSSACAFMHFIDYRDLIAVAVCMGIITFLVFPLGRVCSVICVKECFSFAFPPCNFCLN